MSEMAKSTTMVKRFTQMCPKTSRSPSNIALHRQCLVLTKSKLEVNQSYQPLYQVRTFSEGPGGKDPKKEEQIEAVKMPGFIHPQTRNEEGYFTQKAHEQLEELKKKMGKPTIDNSEKKE